VVLVSGGPGCCDYLEPVASLIDNIVNTIRFDARGCGRSSLTPPYDVQTAIADIDELRKKLELATATT
jgi:proline iminopeptidase